MRLKRRKPFDSFVASVIVYGITGALCGAYHTNTGKGLFLAATVMVLYTLATVILPKPPSGA